MPSSHLILCRPLLILPRIPPSIRVFSNESTLCMMWPKYWSFSFSIIPSKEIPGLISSNGLVGSPCSPRDSQVSSPTPQFKSISSSALSLLYGPTFTSPKKLFGVLRQLGKSRSKILWGPLVSPSSYAEYAGSLPAHRTLGFLGHSLSCSGGKEQQRKHQSSASTSLKLILFLQDSPLQRRN